MKESTGSRLKHIMRVRGLKQVDILDRTKIFEKQYGVKIGKTDLSQYVNDKVEPRQDKLYVLALALNVSEAWLMGYDVPQERADNKNGESASDLLKIYDQLEKPRKRKVFNFADHQLEEQNKVISMEEYNTIKLQSLLSAGTGIIDLDPDYAEELQYKGYVPEHDLAFRVSGNSMEPMFKDSEIIFVEKTTDIRTGQIVAVQINEEAFIKKAYIENDQLRLVSLNKEYKDVIADNHDDIRIVGRVIL